MQKRISVAEGEVFRFPFSAAGATFCLAWGGGGGECCALLMEIPFQNQDLDFKDIESCTGKLIFWEESPINVAFHGKEGGIEHIQHFLGISSFCFGHTFLS